MPGVITIKVFETGPDQDLTDAMTAAIAAAQTIADDIAEEGGEGGWSVTGQAIYNTPAGRTVKVDLSAPAVPEP